jgi:tRNA G18 (ribose-2'-O)-methylase SpoU
MKKKSTQKNDIRILMHNIRSTHNVGAMFRTADAVGVSHIYLSGYTPAPLDRFGRPVKEITKTALGAELTIPWEYCKDPTVIITKLKTEGFVTLGIEQDERAVDYKTYTPPEKTLVLVGSEVEGLSVDLRALCDVLCEIPMHGEKESLNVSVAFGIALFRLFDR